MFAPQTITTGCLMWHLVNGTSHTVCGITVHKPCLLLIVQRTAIVDSCCKHCSIIPYPPMPNLNKKKKKVPVRPTKTNNQSITRNLENRDKDSKLPVEEDAGIHSKSFTDGTHGALRRACSALQAPQFSFHAKPWLRSRKKIQRAAPPKACPKTQAREGVDTTSSHYCSSMKWEWHKITYMYELMSKTWNK